MLPTCMRPQGSQYKVLLCRLIVNNLCFVLSFIITLKYFKCDTSNFIYTNKFNQYLLPQVLVGAWSIPIIISCRIESIVMVFCQSISELTDGLVLTFELDFLDLFKRIKKIFSHESVQSFMIPNIRFWGPLPYKANVASSLIASLAGGL